MSQEPPRDRLPFEPGKRKKPAKNKPTPQASATPAPAKQKSTPRRPMSKAERAIPEVVSRRMVSRMVVFCGVPTALGMFTFIASYFILTQEWLTLPHVAVVLVSMGFFGLGVLGLTYGLLSSSWDENTPGSMLGWNEFTINLGRMSAAWRASRQKTP